MRERIPPTLKEVPPDLKRMMETAQSVAAPPGSLGFEIHLRYSWNLLEPDSFGSFLQLGGVEGMKVLAFSTAEGRNIMFPMIPEDARRFTTMLREGYGEAGA
ncbi:MAG: hypothetical protein H0U46_10890 [Actinobacteria bacterium]|nr:hypothetical protein [Actinomycetota bacterium]